MDDEKPLNRRQFFKSAIADIARTVIEFNREKDNLIPKTGNVLRPPGAVEESLFNQLCTVCNECIKVCPHFCIRGSDSEEEAKIGTPILIADNAGCKQCPDQPCIKACKDGALRPYQHTQSPL
ncbi:MAG: hypothetical protein PH343_03860 [Nitrospira sp.]|nr:hypothetical protein [Nitrospira sp.]